MIWTLPLLFVVLALLAWRFGADSRDGRDWTVSPRQRTWRDAGCYGC